MSSFAKQGFESQHNQAYWDRKPYKGIGVGAWSYDGVYRYQNEKQLMRYIEAYSKGDSAVCYKEHLTADQVRFEKVMLGLRKMKGLEIAQAIEGLTPEREEEFFKRVALLQEQKFITRTQNKLFLTQAAFAIENEIAIKLAL